LPTVDWPLTSLFRMNLMGSYSGAKYLRNMAIYRGGETRPRQALYRSGPSAGYFT
jgi:hypothetical protein